MAFSPVEGFVHKTTVASKVLEETVIAGDEFLFRVRLELSCCDEVSSFKCTSCREGPARSATSLVFDVSDGTSSDPVDTIRVGLWEVDSVQFSGAEFWAVTIKALTLVIGPVRHVVVGKTPGVSFGVVLFDVVINLLP